MNYIELINNFWELDEAWQFTCCETRLYFYLVKTANRLGWADSWTHSDDKTSANVGVSRNSLKTARNRLSQAQLISFKEGGKGHANKTRYQILTPKVDPKLPPKPTPKVDPKLSPLLNKLNQTKLNNKSISNDIPKEVVVGYEKFSFDFVEEAFKKSFTTWLDYKKQRKESYKTQRSLELCYKKLLEKSTNDPSIALKIVEESMSNNWAGLFELKQKGGNNGTQKQTGSSTNAAADNGEFITNYVASAITPHSQEGY